MYWVVQENMYNKEGFQKLIAALEQLEIPHSVHKVVPFVGRLEPDIDPTGPVMVMGASTMSGVARDKGWRPGSFDTDDLSYARQLEMWGDHMLNADAEITGFGNVRERPGAFFVRPVLDSKSFAGHVTEWPAFHEWQQRVLALAPEDQVNLGHDTEVMVAPMHTIQRETRTWIVDGAVVAASEYKQGTRVRGSVDVAPRIIDYATKRADGWGAPSYGPARAYCMDIAETPDGLKILECGNINGCGFYAADVTRIVAALDALSY